MARKTRKPSARAAGADYAKEQIGSPYFYDWIHEQMAEAEQMRRADPDSVIPSDTPAGARKVAKNMLQQLEWDTKRELNITAVGFEAGDAKEFFAGFDEELHKPVTVEWLTDIVLRGSEEAHEGEVRETGRGSLPGAVDASLDYAEAKKVRAAAENESMAASAVLQTF